tara:strand:- start:194 stop:340 length:147 start_codon:yes stop_codon:yes gene_type:complete
MTAQESFHRAEKEALKALLIRTLSNPKTLSHEDRRDLSSALGKLERMR